MERTPARQHPDRIETASAGDWIARLQHDVQVLMDGDRVLPADGSSLLAALDQAQERLLSQDLQAARTALEAFVRSAQALVDAGVLAIGDGQPPIEVAALIAASILTTRGIDPGPGRSESAA
jgi:hypothetical protein